MNCIIVEDNELAAKATLKCIERYGDLIVVSMFSSGEEALAFLNENNCDIIFLDIEMRGMNGIDLIKKLKHVPYVVIISSKPDYAAEAFDFDVVDYIVKPIKYERFQKAMKRVKKIADNFQSSGKDFFYAKHDGVLTKVFFKDIIFIEALADYVNIHLAQKRLIVLSTMKAIENQIPSKDFMRIHRSFIVRLDQIKEVVGNAVSVDGKTIPISRTHKEDLLKKINMA